MLISQLSLIVPYLKLSGDNAQWIEFWEEIIGSSLGMSDEPKDLQKQAVELTIDYRKKDA